MSATISPMSVSIGVGTIADRQQRPKSNDRKSTVKAAQRARVDDATQNQAYGQVNIAEEDECLPADTLFTVALIANDLPARPANTDEVMLRLSHEWTPPDSAFQLTDKTI
jgi:hypothetical protein